MSGASYPTRKRPRLADFDYSTSGWYFVTLCTERRALLFGEVQREQMRLSPAGQMVADVWRALEERYPGV